MKFLKAIYRFFMEGTKESSRRLMGITSGVAGLFLCYLVVLLHLPEPSIIIPTIFTYSAACLALTLKSNLTNPPQ